MTAIKCHVCWRDFTTLLDLSAHYFDHHDATFQCYWCTEQFSTKDSLQTHTRFVHINPSNYPCRLCPDRFQRREDLEMHYSKRHLKWVRILYCLPCKLWFANERLFELHSKRVHSGAQLLPDLITFKCQHCPQTFRDRFQHYSHTSRLHGAFVMCSYCEKQFKSDDELKDHCHWNHKNPDSWTCVYCWVNFNSENMLEAHQKKFHQILRCPQCNVIVPTAECLAMHRQHENATATETSACETRRRSEPLLPTPRNADMLLCLICFTRFPVESFYEHAEDHLRQRQPFSCNEHFEFLFDLDSIKSHVTCFRAEALRGLATTLKPDPDGHLKHSVAATSTCEQCGFKAQDDNHLSRHRAWCHSIKFCRECSQETIGRMGMKLHEAEHGTPFWPDEMRNDRCKSISSIPLPNSESPASSSSVSLPKGDAESSGQIPLKSLKRKFHPDISSSSKNSNDNENIKSLPFIAKKSEKSPKSGGHSKRKNIDSMMPDNKNKSTIVEKSFLEAIIQIKDEIVSDDSVSVDEEELQHVRPPPRAAEISENSSTTPKPLRKGKFVPRLFSETPGPSTNATNIASSTPAVNTKNRNDDLQAVSSDSSDDDDDADEPTFTHSRSAKIIPIGTALNNSSAEKTCKSFPIIPPAEENNVQQQQQTPSANSVLKTTSYVCKLCNQFSLYKQSMLRHVETIHRIPLPNLTDHIEIKEMDISSEKIKKRVKTSSVASQCHLGRFTCTECPKKDQVIKELTSWLKKFKNAANKIEKNLV